MMTGRLIVGLILLVLAGAAYADKAARKDLADLKGPQTSMGEEIDGRIEIQERERRHKRIILQLHGWTPYEESIGGTGETSDKAWQIQEHEGLTGEIESLRYRRYLDNIDQR